MSPFRALIILIAVAAVAGVGYLLSTDAASSDPTTSPAAAVESSESRTSEPVAPTVGDTAPAANDSGENTATRAAAETAVVPGAEPTTTARAAACKVIGRVVDEGGAPLAGVYVELATMGGMVIIDESGERQGPRDRTTKSGRDGRFVLDDVRTTGFGLRVRATPANLVTASKPLAKQDGGTIDLGDFVCLIGGSLVGRVVNEAGNPVASANVEAWSIDKAKAGEPGLLVFGDSMSGDNKKAVSDGSGLFRFDGMRPGEAAVAVSAEGHTREFKKGIEIKKGELTPEVKIAISSGLAIEGLIVDASGRPIPEARVRIMETVLDLSEGGLSNELQKSRDIAADANGYYRIGGLKDATYHVVGRAGGFLPATRESVPAGSKDIRITLEKAGMLYGYVRNATDKSPVSGFEIQVQRRDFGGQMFGPEKTEVLYGAAAAAAVGVSDTAGLYVVPSVPSRTVTLMIEADGYAADTSIEVDVAIATKTQQDIALVPEIRLSGIVLGSDDKGVEGAQVSVVPHADEPENFGRGGFRVRATRAASSDGAHDFKFDGQGPVATTDAEGRFTLRGLRPGDFDVRATHRNWAPADKQIVKLEDGESVDDVRLVLKEAGTLIGVAHDADGKAMPGALVSLRPKPKAGGDGRVVLGGGGFPGFDGLESGPKSATSSADGSYRIEGITPGQYLASIKRQSAPRGGGFFMMAEAFGGVAKGQPVAIEAGEETEQDLFLPPTGGVRGTVTEAGQPMANVAVAIREKESHMPMDIANAKTDSDGSYELAEIEPGEYDLIVKAPGAAEPIRKSIAVRARENVDEHVRLPTGGIRGQVRDRDSNKGLKDVTIEVRKHRDQSAPEGEQNVRSGAISMVMLSGGEGGGTQTMTFGNEDEFVRTDADGNFQVRFLEPGDYDVSIHGAGVSPETKDRVAVAESKITEGVKFDAVLGAVIIVTAKPANSDDKIEFVMVEIHPVDAPDESSREANGGNTITIDGLKPGTYAVDVTAGELGGQTTVTVGSGERKPIEVIVR